MASIDAAGLGDWCVLWPGIRRIGSFWGVGGGGFVRWVAGKNSAGRSPKDDGELMILKLPTPMNVVRNFCFILYNAFSTD